MAPPAAAVPATQLFLAELATNPDGQSPKQVLLINALGPLIYVAKLAAAEVGSTQEGGASGQEEQLVARAPVHLRQEAWQALKVESAVLKKYPFTSVASFALQSTVPTYMKPALQVSTTFPVAANEQVAIFVPQASQVQSGVLNLDLSPKVALQTHFPTANLAFGVVVEAESSSISLFWAS